jgi:hypothetical protein
VPTRSPQPPAPLSLHLRLPLPPAPAPLTYRPAYVFMSAAPGPQPRRLRDTGGGRRLGTRSNTIPVPMDPYGNNSLLAVRVYMHRVVGGVQQPDVGPSYCDEACYRVRRRGAGVCACAAFSPLCRPCKAVLRHAPTLISCGTPWVCPWGGV